jgi:hypothetical protein
VEEWRQCSEVWSDGAGWARAKSAIREVAERQSPDSSIDVGPVEHLGRGLHRRAFVADLHVYPDPLELSGRMVALVPDEPGEPAEVRWLAHLRRARLPFAVPRPLGATCDGIVVRSFLPGLPAPRDRWKDCVRAAAALHQLRIELEGDRTTRALEALQPLRRSSHPDVLEAVRWCEQHLPTGPLVLTHGDLRRQNVLLAGSGKAVGVIGWQLVGPGDPGREIAMLTRGARRPFRLGRGLASVVDAYVEAGGARVTEQDVLFHELVMVASAVHETALDHQVGQLRAMLQRSVRES